MRISRGALLILIGFSIPVIVELRTLFGFFGIDLSVTATVAIGLVVIGALVFWATLPDPETSAESGTV